MAENRDWPIGIPLTGVSLNEETMLGGTELQLNEMNFFFSEVNAVLTLRPNAATDEIELTQSIAPAIDLLPPPEWCRPFIGQPLQAVWVCENNQGYQDQVILAFQFLRPSLSFVSESSVLLVFAPQIMKRPKKRQRLRK